MMIDSFILAHLSNGITILDRTYFVGWDGGINRAIVTYTNCEEEGMFPLLDANENEMTFSCELEAHTYLLGLRLLDQKDDVHDWRTI